VVADTVATPIEKLIDKEVEGLVRIESTCDNDGKYTAHLYFTPKTDLKAATKSVELCVWRAEPMLAPEVLQNKVSVKIGKAEARPNQVAIAVIDRLGLGRKELQKRGGAVVKRLAAEQALTKPQLFPGDAVKWLYIDIDLTKCKSLGVTKAELSRAVPERFWTMKSEGLKKLVVRDKVTLGDVAVFKEVDVAAAVYRVDLHSAIRITGAHPKEKSLAAAAARCVNLAEAEVKRLDSPGYRGFAVKNLSAK
jgi:multidrug efflux pump subunit AcrB